MVDFIGHQNDVLINETRDYHRYLGGSPANVAMNCKRLGLSSTLVSTVGNDGFGEYIFKRLEEIGINTSSIKKLELVPLSERVEQTVLRHLQEKGVVTFTDVWNAVSIEFPNSHTTDSMSIKEALVAFSNPIAKGKWLIKSNLRPHEIEREHTTQIAILSEIGRLKGYDIYIGKIEQSHEMYSGTIKNKKYLKEFITYKSINKLKNIQNPTVVDDIDLLWIKNNKIFSLFEVESTTSMTSALQRGSNVDKDVPKFMIMPSDRHNQFTQKMKSPLFYERFINDNWNKIYFENLVEAYTKNKGKTNINEIIKMDPKLRIKKKKIKDDNQIGVFD